MFAAALAAAVFAGPQPPDDPKEPPKKKAAPLAGLREKLKKHEDELGKIREAMLAEIGAEEKRAEEGMKKAEKERAEALKNKDFETAAKAFQVYAGFRAELLQLHQLRNDAETRVRAPAPPPPPAPPEERLGLRLSAPAAVLVAQLGLEKNQGLVVESVKADSPAAQLGLRASDVLVKVGGKPIPTSPAEYRKLLNELPADADAEVIRKGKPETIKGFRVPSAKG